MCQYFKSTDKIILIFLSSVFIWLTTLIDYKHAEPVLYSYDKFYLVVVYNFLYITGFDS
jgi:hypothetical protein